MQLSSTIVITTRNRREEALLAVASAVDQVGDSIEVLVYDDASEDRTSEAIRDQFPQVRLVRSEQRVGYIALRNRGFHEAGGEIVFSIDDDAYFTSAQTVSRVLEVFQEQPRAAAVALPYIEPSTTEPHRWMKQIPADGRLGGFIGCAHALRRKLVLELGGYREFFVHQGEERDLAIRLLERGYEIVFADTPPIVHNFSTQRDRQRMSYYGIRNALLFDMLNVPHPHFLPALFRHAAKLFLYKFRVRDTFRRLGSLGSGLASCICYRRLRQPVSRATYRRYRSLPKHGPMNVDEHTPGVAMVGPSDAGTVG